jgi:hypothetical protein
MDTKYATGVKLADEILQKTVKEIRATEVSK